MASSSCSFKYSVCFLLKHLQCIQTLLRVCQHNRVLWAWSDHSIQLGYGLVLIVVGAVYDPLVYLIDDEVAKSHKSTKTAQEMVEQGEAYIKAHCSSSSAREWAKHIRFPHFFKGDKQSAWFETGKQRGGTTVVLHVTVM